MSDSMRSALPSSFAILPASAQPTSSDGCVPVPFAARSSDSSGEANEHTEKDVGIDGLRPSTDAADEENFDPAPRTGSSPTSISASFECARSNPSDERWMAQSSITSRGGVSVMEFGIVNLNQRQDAVPWKPPAKKRRLSDDLSSQRRFASVKSGLPANTMYRDAQLLKFHSPSTCWAPNIKELHHVRAGMRVEVAIQSVPKTKPSTSRMRSRTGAGVSFGAAATGACGPRKTERFWVKVVDAVSENTPSDHGRNFERRTFIAATTEADLTNFLLLAGSMIIFEARNIVNADDLTKRQLAILLDFEMRTQEKSEEPVRASQIFEPQKRPVEMETGRLDTDTCDVDNEEEYWKQKLAYL